MNKDRCQEIIAGQLVWYIFDSGANIKVDIIWFFDIFRNKADIGCIFHFLHSIACNKGREYRPLVFPRSLIFSLFFLFVPSEYGSSVGCFRIHCVVLWLSNMQMRIQFSRNISLVFEVKSQKKKTTAKLFSKEKLSQGYPIQHSFPPTQKIDP